MRFQVMALRDGVDGGLAHALLASGVRQLQYVLSLGLECNVVFTIVCT
jgi:hypothetical protein